MKDSVEHVVEFRGLHDAFCSIPLLRFVERITILIHGFKPQGALHQDDGNDVGKIPTCKAKHGHYSLSACVPVLVKFFSLLTRSPPCFVEAGADVFVFMLFFSFPCVAYPPKIPPNL